MPIATTSMTLGAQIVGGQTSFRVWAPAARRVLLRFEDGRSLPMQREENDIFSATLQAGAGERYFYQVDDHKPVPDPVSRLLPEGVHGPTEVVDPAGFSWSDSGWRGVNLRDYLIYELHVGTFTPRGTFDGVIEQLDYLKRLGVTVIELMPVAAFPGIRNWGYDAVSPYAVQASYGGPDGLKRLIDAAHAAGLGVMLDVIYNHLGNEGNYLGMFGPYFSGRHKTPWSDGVNFDSRGCEQVRQYFIENALYWVREYHADGLRLDAIHAIKDDSRYHIVEEIRDRVQQLANQLRRRVCVIAETHDNDARLVLPKMMGGFGLDAAWSDDFHHAIHTVLTGEKEGYYQDFGRKEQIVRALNEGFVFQGEMFHFWGKPRGTHPDGVPLPAHVICIQNHDQVGNRARGERLHHLVADGASKLAAALLLLAPETPLLFMGEEYGDPAPFQFFTDYGDPVLQEAVSKGRREEFKSFAWNEVPDPQAPATFERSKLHLPTTEENSTLRWYRELIALRKQFVVPAERTCRAELRDGNLTLQVPREYPQIMLAAEFPDRQLDFSAAAGWREVLSNEGDGYRTRVCVRDL